MAHNFIEMIPQLLFGEIALERSDQRRLEP